MLIHGSRAWGQKHRRCESSGFLYPSVSLPTRRGQTGACVLLFSRMTSGDSWFSCLLGQLRHLVVAEGRCCWLLSQGLSPGSAVQASLLRLSLAALAAPRPLRPRRPWSPRPPRPPRPAPPALRAPRAPRAAAASPGRTGARGPRCPTTPKTPSRPRRRPGPSRPRARARAPAPAAGDPGGSGAARGSTARARPSAAPGSASCTRSSRRSPGTWCRASAPGARLSAPRGRLLLVPPAPRLWRVLGACGAAARIRPLSQRFPAEQDVAPAATGLVVRHVVRQCHGEELGPFCRLMLAASSAAFSVSHRSAEHASQM